MAPPPRRGHLIIKPVPVPGVGGDPVPHICRRLRDAGITCEVTRTQPDRPAAEDVRAALAAGPRPDLFIAAGGDGTHSAVGAALAGSRLPLGLVPLGTFNNLARGLGIPRDLDAAVDIIVAGHQSAIDAGRVNGRVFLEVAGAGWDATLFPIGEEIKRGKLGALLAAAREVMGYRADPITLRLDESREVTVQTPTVVVANGPYYGSSFAVAPASRLDDGLLTATVFESFGKAELLAHFAAIADGQPRADARVITYRAARIEVVSPPDLPAHADGQPLGPLRTPFEALPHTLIVFRPRTTSAATDSRTKRTMRWSVGDIAAAPAAAPEGARATEGRA